MSAELPQNTLCPKCNKEMVVVDEAYMTFRHKTSTCTPKLRMEWCTNCEYEHVQIIKKGSRLP